MKYKIQIEPEAQSDIQRGIAWYNAQQKGLGRKFHGEVKEFLEYLKFSPFHEIKYDNVRCLPLKKYPYTLHFSINEIDKTVIIRAVFHASQDPEKWKTRL